MPGPVFLIAYILLFTSAVSVTLIPPPDFLFDWFIFLIKNNFSLLLPHPQASFLMTWKLYNRILLSVISFEFSSDSLDLREQKVSEHPSPVCGCTRTRALPGHTVPAFAGAEAL